MNKNLLKWILIAAVILGAAGYLILSETSSNSKKEQIVVGHSKPFKIEPVEGITISAPKNALDKDREFKLTPVDDKTYDKVTEVIKRAGMKNLMVFELDAGLRPDEHFPGDFTVEIDLDRLGIPRSLQSNIYAYRVVGKGKDMACFRHISHTSGGKLTFQSNQNSALAVGIAGGLVCWGLQNVGRIVFEVNGSPEKWFQRYFINEPTSLSVPFQDDSGDFVIYFRWRDTENPEGFKAYIENEEAAFKRLDELEKQAERDWNKQVSDSVAKKQKGYNVIEKLFSYKQVQAIKESISKEEILQRLKDHDSEWNRLNSDPASQLPPSILKIRERVIRANQYLNSIGLHPFNFEMPIYLVNGEVMGSDVTGVCKKYNLFCGNCYMLLRYVIGDLQEDEKNWEKMQTTLVHELFHGRQQSYYAITMMGSCPAEATAAVLERDASLQWQKDSIIKLHDPHSITCFDTPKDLLTDRTKTEIYGYPFDDINGVFSWVDEATGYSMGSAIEGIREGVGKDTITMQAFASSYSRFGPHITTWSKWIKKSLNINDEQFAKGYRYFGETNLPRIYSAQSIVAFKDQNIGTVDIGMTSYQPMVHLKRLSKPRDYAVNTYNINLPKKAEGVFEEDANVFIYSKSGVFNPYVSFYWSDNAFEEYYKIQGKNKYLLKAEPALFYAGNRYTDYKRNEDGSVLMSQTGQQMTNNKSGYQLAVVTTRQSKDTNNDYFVVALFAPNAPTIRKVKEDQITFIVPKPARALTKEKLITGVVVTYKDKNGKEITREIEPKYFGKKATWTVTGCSKNGNSFTLSAHWYYKPDEQTTYVSPESDPAQWGAKGDEPEEEVVQTKEPETNYWKQVSSRMTMKNTSIDVDESNDDEVSSDYRSIDLQAAKTGRSLEFSGMGATEEKTKENGRVYVQDIFIEGTLTYTEPPKFWIPTQQYKAHWEIADDPYLTKVSDPFVFEAKNTSSDQAACTQSKKDKIDNGRSSVGKVNWLRGSTTTFEARHPEKNGPKSFTLTQTYSIKERQGSDLMATVTFVYNYEWVGEEEPEPELETENVPEGGYWKLVKTYEDKSKAAGETHPGKTVITGGRGNYKLNWQYEGTKIVPGGKASQSVAVSPPQKTYLPGEKINFDYSFGDLSIEGKANTLIAGVHGNDGGLELLRGICRDYKETNNGTFGFVNSIRVKKSSGSSQSHLTAPTQKEVESFSNGHQFSIVDRASAAGGIYCTIYVYEWVGGKKAEPVKEPAKEKPITGGHWKLIHTGVSTEQGMITGSAKGITIQGSNGHYTAHVERDGMISDREINFEKPKSVYMPGEEITLKVTNEKPKIKGGKEGMSYGDIVFSTGQWDGCVEYEGDWDDKPSYSNKKVVGVAKGSAPSKPGTPGAVGFFIKEYIKVYGSISTISTCYNYAWEE